jgi:AcrR family transcriptional regulator
MMKQDRAVRTQRAVLVAAGEAFAENGFLGTSIADILERAQVTKGALYFHFASKEDLAVALIAAEEEAAARMAEEELSRSAPPLQALVALVTRWAQAIQTDPIIRAGVRLIIERGTYDTPMPEPYNRWTARVADLLQAAADGDELRKGLDPKAAAEFIVAAFTGIQLVSQTSSGHQDLQLQLQSMWNVLFSGLIADSHKVLFVQVPS